MKFLKLIDKYILFSFSYSGIRKLYNVKDIKYKELIDDKIEERPILYTDKFFLFIFSGLLGIYSFPYLLISDIQKVEKKIRNIDDFPISNYEITRKNNKPINFVYLLDNDF